MSVLNKDLNIFLDSVVEEIEDYAIIMLDLDGNITGWNKGAEKVKGYLAEEILGHNFEIFYPHTDREQQLPQRLLAQAIREGKSRHTGWRVKHDSSVFWAKVLITAVHDNLHNVVGFVKVTRDLSFEASLAEQGKNIEEQVYKMMGEIQDVSLIMLNINGDILNWNTGSQKIHGFTAEQMLGKNISFLFSEQDTQSGKPRHLLEEALQNNKAITEVWLLKRDGSYLWARLILTPINDKHKKHIGYYSLLFDITDKKTYEDTLLKQQSEVELKSREIEQFAFIASHDLQQPLRTITALAEIINQKNFDRYDASDKKAMHYLLHSAGRMKELINHLLDYSRLGLNADFKPLNLGHIVQNVLDDLRSVIQNTGAVIEVCKLPVISASQTHIRLLFQNLITNALKFSKPHSTPKVKIACREDEHYWEFYIEDNGIGIVEKDFQKIFLIFQRVCTGSQYEGNGIGLAFCEKIVKLHGGTIWPESVLGTGSKFHFTILKKSE